MVVHAVADFESGPMGYPFAEVRLRLPHASCDRCRSGWPTAAATTTTAATVAHIFRRRVLALEYQPRPLAAACTHPAAETVSLWPPPAVAAALSKLPTQISHILPWHGHFPAGT